MTAPAHVQFEHVLWQLQATGKALAAAIQIGMFAGVKDVSAIVDR